MAIRDRRHEHAGVAGLGDVVERLSVVSTVAELADVIRTSARRTVAADGATFVLREDDRCFYVDEDGIAPMWKGQRFPISECISGWAMEHAEPVVVPDITVDDRIPQAAYRPTFVQSLMMVPVGEPTPLAAIGAYWARQHRATEQEQHRLTVLADCAAVTLERIGLESAPWAPTFTRT